ncbi:MAG: amino acid ABC transporter permease [Castellaniella sp.]|uniref:amino acid ABC transporter permease n=1 Tax=Castellaniella sp. TaxID=1955812 RepID=UPI001220961B|nr:amino acid ABC transporter permease [Castellaniella sp.]TAN25817.1 MAG: amino acid ABC transporter permease [Castellaniella sp.]
MAYDVNFAVIWNNWHELLSGLGLGLFLAVVSIGIGCFIGLVSAFASLSSRRWISKTANVYVTVVRNLPILLIVLFAFFALPDVGVRMGKLESFIASLAVYSGAYLSEVFRGGLLAVPVGVIEAGKSIGLTPMQVRFYVTFPIMMKNALPSLGNNFISLFKDTSIASIIAIPELTFYAEKLNTETFRAVEVWLTTAIMYVVTCYLIALGLRFLERRYVTEAVKR